MNSRFIESLEIEDEVQVEESQLDPILLQAELKRQDLISNFDGLGFQEARISSGAVDRIAYWEWNFTLHDSGNDLFAVVVLCLDTDKECTYEVGVRLHDQVWTHGAVVLDASVATEKAFEALKKVFRRVADEEQETHNE